MVRFNQKRAVVAGHICLDVIPSFASGNAGIETLLVPGKLVNVGPMTMSTGGAVSNTGVALHRLGIETTLMGKVGDDLFGSAIVESLRSYSDRLAEGMIVSTEADTSYTVVINPPGVDRIFLHCPGANDTFHAEDVGDDKLESVSLFHFGYPPLMRSMYLNDGEEMERLLRRVKGRGIVTSLDMSRPDPDSEAGQVDWERFLDRVLPHVDLFLPSLEEIMFMLDRGRYEAFMGRIDEDPFSSIDGDTLSSLADRLLAKGAAIVAIKLGEQGLYVRTTDDSNRMNRLGLFNLAETAELWLERELLTPCFVVQVAGTTGAGDCTIAGFLAGLLHQLAPEEAIQAAAAVGACNVERADATSGVPDWDTVHRRIKAGWERRQVSLQLPGWTRDHALGLWIGPHNRKFE